jgi:hypothetical protein
MTLDKVLLDILFLNLKTNMQDCYFQRVFDIVFSPINLFSLLWKTLDS